MKLTINCDGGARGNPGPAAAAFVVYTGKRKLYEDAIYLGKTTNNYAEYLAVEEALVWLKAQKGVEAASFYLDSELVVKQIAGVYKVKSESLKPVYNSVMVQLRFLPFAVRFFNVPRDKNKEADFLVNKVLDEHKG
jgi:ribonuclease HI